MMPAAITCLVMLALAAGVFWLCLRAGASTAAWDDDGDGGARPGDDKATLNEIEKWRSGR